LNISCHISSLKYEAMLRVEWLSWLSGYGWDKAVKMRYTWPNSLNFNSLNS